MPQSPVRVAAYSYTTACGGGAASGTKATHGGSAGLAVVAVLVLLVEDAAVTGTGRRVLVYNVACCAAGASGTKANHAGSAGIGADYCFSHQIVEADATTAVNPTSTTLWGPVGQTLRGLATAIRPCGDFL
jgi:hypothetical protein